MLTRDGVGGATEAPVRLYTDEVLRHLIMERHHTKIIDRNVRQALDYAV